MKTDYVHQKWNKLTAIKYIESKCRHQVWEFKCDCGNITKHLIGNVKRGQPKCCGCSIKNRKKTEIENLTGQKFNKLTLIKCTNTKKRQRWLCRCDCGNKKEINLYSIKSGITKSCGCLSGKKRRKYNQYIDNFITNNYQNLTQLQIANKLNISTSVIQRRVKILGIKKEQKGYQFNEQQFLNAIKSSTSHNEASKKLGYKGLSGYNPQTTYGKLFNKLKPDITHFSLRSKSHQKSCLEDTKIMHWYNNNKKMAIKAGRKFSLSFIDFQDIVEQPCYYCNDRGDSGPYKNRQWCGIDRVNNKKYYTLNNCVPCCKYCNRMKHTKNKKQFFKQIKQIYENLKLDQQNFNGESE